MAERYDRKRAIAKASSWHGSGRRLVRVKRRRNQDDDSLIDSVETICYERQTLYLPFRRVEPMKMPRSLIAYFLAAAFAGCTGLVISGAHRIA